MPAPSAALELLYDYLENRPQAAAGISARPPVGLAALGFVLGGLSLAAAAAVGRGAAPAPWAWLVAGGVLWRFFSGLIMAAVLHLLLTLLKENGSAAGLFAQFGLSELAWTLVVPLAVLARLIFPYSLAAQAAVFAIAGAANLGLKARGLADNYGISPAKSWFVLLLPYLACFAFAALLALAALIGAAIQISGMLFV